MERTYLAIDLKSFYASAECAELHLNPLTANLVVADESRTSKTICLAVSPALKKFGVPGRPRLFEVEQIVGRVNRERAKAAPGHRLAPFKSIYRPKLLKNPALKVDFKIVPPRMSFYLKKSAEIYEIYLRYLPPEMIHPYSIDEVFMDVTDYLNEHHITAHALAKEIIQTIQLETMITATAGIGPNLFLAKVAMDIVAKRIPADQDGVRIAQMNEQEFRQHLWAHEPLTDFWRVGRGYAKRLQKLGLNTMGDIARCSLGKLSDPLNEEVLYREFGKNAELLIDHAWGFESATIKDIKSYRSSNHGIYSSIVLPKPYRHSEAKLVVREMVDMLSLQMVKRDLVADQFSLTVDYDVQSLHQGHGYHGPTTTDFYGREVPHPDHGGFSTKLPTSSSHELIDLFLEVYREKANPDLYIRRVTVTANHLIKQEVADQMIHTEQLDLFTNTDHHIVRERQAELKRQQDKEVQKMVLQLQDQFGKNSIIRAADLKDGAVAKKRNNEIGGHRA
ncbi:MAG: LytTR family transcriptional regulator [Limosilactobacillus sp.]|uniref:Y-family DNA polymerase n=1 Tax=Limosilactobacillus sp. TaxID=2773925 RepID=UPI00270948AF|nr:LytTR family transcriptional regulator [Limosilactobacillus sp.]